MSVLLYLIPIALTLGLLGLIAFLWAVDNNQFEDIDGASYRALHEDNNPQREN